MPGMAIDSPAVDGLVRCTWPGADPLNLEHHDLEWGVPSRDRRHLFELLTLEGAQAGLSWTTILRKRDGYRAAFAGFDPERVAAFTPDDVDRLMLDPGIVRNRSKITATIDNARAVLALEGSGIAFVDHLWSFVGGHPIQNRFTTLGQIPAETPESKAMSKDLKARGFRFVGPTILYAFMESAGLVNDHTIDCYRHAEVAARA
jgi:DNA-3-methyladenine glycosylase I